MSSLYDLALTVPWCITPEALTAMLSIAAREPLDEEAVASAMHGPKTLALRAGKRREDSGRMTMQGPIAVIPIDGPIYRYADYFTRVSGGVTTEQLAKDFQAALDDPAVSGILFTIDSPGGEAIGINELSDTIYAARGRKPITAYIEGYGASAAYWIASAADRVLVDDNALVGSIGTVMGVPDPSKRVKYTIDFVSSQSPKKRADPTTDAGRVYLQQLVDDMTEVFIAKVIRNRGLSARQVLQVEGGLVIGQAAVRARLADGLGSEEGAIRALLAPAASRRLRAPQPADEAKVFSVDWWRQIFAAQWAAEPTLATAAPALRAPVAILLPAPAAQIVRPVQAPVARIEASSRQVPRPSPGPATTVRTIEERLQTAERQAQALARPLPMTMERKRELLNMTSLGRSVLPMVERHEQIEQAAARRSGMTVARRRELLNMTPLGRRVLAAERKQARDDVLGQTTQGSKKG